MSFHADLKADLVRWLGVDKVVFMKNWDRPRRGFWVGRTQKPVALLVHHTAGAATDSTDPKHPGNKRGANDGVINFVQTHYEVPAANFTLDRDGTVYVHCAYPVWHAGLGAFTSWPYSSLGVVPDRGNDFMLGVEVVSKGVKRDFTDAQKESLGALAQACKQAAGWSGVTKRLPNHKTWAPTRKVDTKYPLSWILAWAVRAARRGPKAP